MEQDLSVANFSEELLLWYNAVILRLIDHKTALQTKMKDGSLKSSFSKIEKLQGELEAQFADLLKTVSKVKSIWSPGEEDHPPIQSKLLSELHVLREGGIKELLINGRQVYPIPSYADISHLSFIKLETVTQGILDVLSGCQHLENIAIGGGDKFSNVDDIMLSRIIQKLPKLRVISLWDTTISDKGVQQLKRLENLESVAVESESFTSEGKKSAQETFKGISSILSIKKS